MWSRFRSLFLSCLLSVSASVVGQTPPEWSRPVPPRKIVGNIYYVGTEDLACYLITDPKGHILINSGLADSAKLIVANVEALGFRVQDIRILLTNQGHYDHTAALAAIQELSGAKMLATPPDAPMLRDGGASDPVGGPEYRFAPVKVDRLLADGEIVELGGIRLKVHYHFGHTPGSASYEMKLAAGGVERMVLFANMGTIVIPLSSPTYPKIVQDLENTFRRQLALKPDIWLSTHASQCGLMGKFQTGKFIDPEGYLAAVQKLEKRFRQQRQIELGTGK